VVAVSDEPGAHARIDRFARGGPDAPRWLVAVKAMGVARRTDGGERQLDAGLAFLRSELTKLAQTYPAEAERLRIPGSVEAIDSRLAAATVGQPPDE
jgi:hypothetical protein